MLRFGNYNSPPAEPRAGADTTTVEVGDDKSKPASVSFYADLGNASIHHAFTVQVMYALAPTNTTCSDCYQSLAEPPPSFNSICFG